LAVTPLIISTLSGVLFAANYGQVQGYLLLVTMILSVGASILITNGKNK